MFSRESYRYKNPPLNVSEKLLKIKGYYLNIDTAFVLDEEPDALYCPLVNCNMKRRIKNIDFLIIDI